MVSTHLSHNTYAIFQLDPVRSVSHLKDQKATTAASAMMPKSYLVKVSSVCIPFFVYVVFPWLPCLQNRDSLGRASAEGPSITEISVHHQG